MALLESFRRADLKAQASFKEHEIDEGTLSALFGGIYDGISSGTLTVHATLSDGADQVAKFFRDLSIFGPSSSEAKRSAAEAAKRCESSVSTGSDATVDASTSSSSSNGAADRLNRPSGVYRVDYQRYPISGYIKLPSALQPFVSLPIMDHVVVVAKPSGDVSGGLENYRDAVPKEHRAAAPIFAVIDAPGKKIKDKGYLWIEVPLSDIFKLDVSKMKSVDDYLATLSRKARWNFKDRQKKFAQGLSCAYVPLPPGSKQQVDAMWPLYKSTGEKNGFTVLNETEFYDFHLNTPDLSVMLIKDRDTGELVTFCTGVRAGDTLMPMWCGTDYENDKSRKCSSYFNMLYEYVKIGIADPAINWIDLGASRRSAKTAIGFQGYPVSIYIRCKNSVQEALYSQMMSTYFRKEDLINDP